MNVSLTDDGIMITASQGSLPLDVHETFLLLDKLKRMESVLYDIIRRDSKTYVEEKEGITRHDSSTPDHDQGHSVSDLPTP